MKEPAAYQNYLTSFAPALVAFMLDISRPLAVSMLDGRPRADVAQDLLTRILTEIVRRSVRGRDLILRYRLAIVAYSDEVHDVTKGVCP